MTVNLLLRADGGTEIGYGHLVRTSAVAEAVLEANGSVTVVTTTLEAAADVFPGSVDLVAIDSRDDPAPFVDVVDDLSPDVALTDAYPVDTDYQRTVRDRVPLVVVDDLARDSICADLLVNGNLYAPSLDYEFVGADPRTCLGTEYTLLRSAIRRFAIRQPPWHEVPERALVTMGGSDVAELTPTVVRAFDGMSIQVDVVVGPGVDASLEQRIRAATTETAVTTDVTRDPADLAARMFRADLAISTASSATYELLALGTPIVAIPVVANQELIAEELRERDVATVLDRDVGSGRIREAVDRYVTDTEIRRDRRDRGRTLVDGRGVERIHAELLSLVDDQSSA